MSAAEDSIYMIYMAHVKASLCSMQQAKEMPHTVSEGMQEGVDKHVMDQQALQINSTIHAGALEACSMRMGNVSRQGMCSAVAGRMLARYSGVHLETRGAIKVVCSRHAGLLLLKTSQALYSA